jgi:WxcM-like protein
MRASPVRRCDVGHAMRRVGGNADLDKSQWGIGAAVARIERERNPGGGLYIGARVWAQQTYFGNAMLLVFASLPFDPASYIEES